VWWQFIRALPVPGMGILISPFLIGLGYVMDGYRFVMFGLQPWLIQLIGALLFMLSAIGIFYKSWVLNQIPIRGVSAQETTGGQQTFHQPARNARWLPLAISSIIIMGILSLTLYVIEGKTAAARLDVNPFQISPPGDPSRAPSVDASGVLINFITDNPSEEIISGARHNFRIEKVDHPLSAHEEDKIMSDVIDGTEIPKAGGPEIYPHKRGGWCTVHDKKTNTNDWHDGMLGNAAIYVFVAVKYLVLGHIHVTESCMILTKYYSAVNYCIGHNRALGHTPGERS
jgi:hypothetical protein